MLIMCNTLFTMASFEYNEVSDHCNALSVNVIAKTFSSEVTEP